MTDLHKQDLQGRGIVNELRRMALEFPTQTILINQHITQVRRAIERNPQHDLNQVIVAVTEAQAFIERIRKDPPVKLGRQVRV